MQKHPRITLATFANALEGALVTRETIDIEALLVRAYREKRVHLFGQDSERERRAWGRILLCGPAGTGGGFSVGDRVQSSSFAEKLAARQSEGWAMLSACDGSLTALHDAVLALPTFYAERLGGLDFQVWDEATALGMGHRITVEGEAARIERVRRRGGKDAKRAHELRPCGPARPLVPIEATTLLVCHAVVGKRPVVPPVVIERRRPVYAGADKRAVGHVPVYETPLVDVIQARAVYATWHACLGLLAKACEGFEALAVTGPAAPAVVWADAEALFLGPVSRAPRTARKTGKNDTFATA